MSKNSNFIVTDITNIGDPQILLYEDTYYCYATSFIKGFYVRTSTDLIHWSEPEVCFDGENTWGKADFWAPEVVYHDGRFVMHYSAANDDYNYRYRIGVAVSDSPKGPFTDVYGKPMFDYGYAAIDASVLITDKHNYLYYSKDGYGNVINGINVSQVYCAELDDTLTKLISEPKLMTTPEHDYELISTPVGQIWNEGPNVIEYNGKYVMNYSANYYRTNFYSICMAVSDDPLGPWHKPDSNPVFTNNGALFGAGHNAFFKGKDGKLYTSFHVQTNPENPGSDRRVVIGAVEFIEDNTGDLKQVIVGCLR